MHRLLSVSALLCGAVLFSSAVYTACSTNTTAGPTADDGDTCKRRAKYAAMADIELHQIMLWAEYQSSHGIVLTTHQETTLADTGDLVGALTLDRPVKFPNGKIDMPAGWLPDLPPGHPWETPPLITEDTFAAWFEVRVVDPLLYDPASTSHVGWAEDYLMITNRAQSSLITSFIGADSSCP